MHYRIATLHTAPTHKAQHALSEAIAKEMLAEALQLPADTLIFLKDAHGKPYLEGYPMHFNISHSETKVLCVLHDAPVGADIQVVRPIPQKVLKRICSPIEQQYIGDDPVRFAEVWTRKEAYAKCDGKGLSLGLQHIETVDETGLSADICSHRVYTQAVDGYVFSIVLK